MAEQKRANIYLYDGVSGDEYIKLRTTRDRTLNMPALLLPAVQINIRAGRLPELKTNGIAYLKIPLDRF